MLRQSSAPDPPHSARFSRAPAELRVEPPSHPALATWPRARAEAQRARLPGLGPRAPGARPFVAKGVGDGRRRNQAQPDCQARRERNQGRARTRSDPGARSPASGDPAPQRAIRRSPSPTPAASTQRARSNAAPKGKDRPLPEGGLALEELAGDHEALDLVGALVDLHELGVAHQLLDRVLASCSRCRRRSAPRRWRSFMAASVAKHFA